jgi:rhodanese-related sulfurtransferase
MMTTNRVLNITLAVTIAYFLLFSLTNLVIESMPKESRNIKSEVDRFLTSIPSGHYAIANVEGLKNLLKDSQTVLVDVRESPEYQAGYIPNAINIPLRTLVQSLDQIPRDRPVVIYCSSGYRSAMGVMTLHLLGYEKVQGFPPSFAGWKAAGAETAKL